MTVSETMNDHIRNLQERLRHVEQERDGLRGVLQKIGAECRELREALRPFAEACRQCRQDGDHKSLAVVATRHFARAAELVPETSPP